MYPKDPQEGRGAGGPRGAQGWPGSTCWWPVADGSTAAPGERVCPNKPPPSPLFPASRLDGSVLCLSPHPHHHAPALMRLPNCCILTEGCCSLLQKEMPPLLGELLRGAGTAVWEGAASSALGWSRQLAAGRTDRQTGSGPGSASAG